MTLLEGNNVKILTSKKTDWDKDCNRSMAVDMYFQSRDAFPIDEKDFIIKNDLSFINYSMGIESGERFQVQTVTNYNYFTLNQENLDYAFQVRIKGENAEKLIEQLKSDFPYLSE